MVKLTISDTIENSVFQLHVIYVKSTKYVLIRIMRCLCSYIYICWRWCWFCIFIIVRILRECIYNLYHVWWFCGYANDAYIVYYVLCVSTVALSFNCEQLKLEDNNLCVCFGLYMYTHFQSIIAQTERVVCNSFPAFTSTLLCCGQHQFLGPYSVEWTGSSIY